jgi:NitT/TauT family transport system ATP-binding protein
VTVIPRTETRPSIVPTGLPRAEANFVSARGVSKTFEVDGDVVDAVERIDLNIASGEFVTLLGPSGCGKSTLLMMIGGLETTTHGRIEIAGRPVTGPRPDIGIMFQDATLLPWKSAVDNVLFPFQVTGRRVGDHRDRAAALLQRVGLGGFESKKPSQLSGGMRQRVALCRALIDEPELLLMDEPFSALDAITRDEMNVVLMDLWSQYRKTVIFVTHSLREAAFLSDRVVVMSRRPGRILADIRIDLPRPRDPSVGETREFNEICAVLREKITEAHGGAPGGHTS